MPVVSGTELSESQRCPIPGFITVSNHRTSVSASLVLLSNTLSGKTAPFISTSRNKLTPPPWFYASTDDQQPRKPPAVQRAPRVVLMRDVIMQGVYSQKYVAVHKLQVAILARSSRVILKLFVSTDSTSSHEFASQFGLTIFYTRKTPKNSRKPYRPRECLFQWTSYRPRKGAVTASRLVASDTPNSDKLNGDNCGHSGDKLSQNGEKATSQNGDNESFTLTA